MIKETVKWILFPGTNLNARLRTKKIAHELSQKSSNGSLQVLDAGCGNGSLAYQSFKLGNHVLGVSIKDEVARNKTLFNGRLGISDEKLKFEELNLYDVAQLGPNRFDQIICTEVLEHIRGDEQVCRGFFEILKPGGTLHVCCPNAEHPYHEKYPLDPDETGGHVRPGYTAQTYRELLEPIGFELSQPKGISGFWRHKGNEVIRSVEKVAGVAGGVLVFPFVAPVAWLDNIFPSKPFSLYLQATKPAAN